MSLSPLVIADLVSLNAPVLCVDTCTILDVIRDITRATAVPHDANAGLALLSAAEAGSDLIVLMAEQVTIELADHVDDVEEEAQNALAKFRTQAHRIHDVALAYGAEGVLPLHHLDGHVSRSRTVLHRWQEVASVVPCNDGVVTRALGRVNKPRAPAQRGKESMKDCVIVEAYIEAAGQLRSAGLTKPIVFASSNTKEYYAANTRHLQSELAEDLEAVDMGYAPNFGAARHSLGL